MSARVPRCYQSLAVLFENFVCTRTLTPVSMSRRTCCRYLNTSMIHLHSTRDLYSIVIGIITITKTHVDGRRHAYTPIKQNLHILVLKVCCQYPSTCIQLSIASRLPYSSGHRGRMGVRIHNVINNFWM